MTARMILTIAALAVALLAVTVAAFEGLPLPETTWLMVWGVGLLAGAALTKNLSRTPGKARVAAKPHEFIVKAA
jgi:hypothetical protein